MTLTRHIRASRIRNLGTRFFVHLISYLRTRSCTSHFVHLKQSFVDAWTLTCTYYRDNILEYKINLSKVYSANHQRRTWVYRVYRLFFIKKKPLQTCVLSKQNQRPDNFLSTVFESNEHGLSFTVFVALRQRDCYQTL